MDASSNDSPATVLPRSPTETNVVLTCEDDEVAQYIQKFNEDAPSVEPLLDWSLGYGLGPISLEFFVREKWPLRNKENTVQYRKFAQLMYRRIVAGESNNKETACFCEMFGTLEHWLYMTPLIELLPESKEKGPPPVNEQFTTLFEHVHKILDAKEKELFEQQVNQDTFKEEPASTVEGVMAETRQEVAKILFGPQGLAGPTPTMTRFLKSWVELAYPDKGQTSRTNFSHLSSLIMLADSVVQETMDKYEKTGKVMSRDSLGLPRGLFDPSTQSQRGVKPHDSNTHKSGAQKKLAPVTVESLDHRRGPMTKGSSMPSSPPKPKAPRIPPGFTASDARHKPDDGGCSSAEMEDSPPDSLLEQLTEEEKRALGKTQTQTDPQKASGSGFAAFEKRAPYDYGRYARPTTEETQMVCQVKKVGWSACTKTKTGNGMLVARGFDKPSPAKGRAMLKEIDQTAAGYRQMPPDEPIMLCKPDPANIRRQPSKTLFQEMKHVTEDDEGVGHLSADKKDMKLEDMELASSEGTVTIISFS
ncbi:MAG: hypothetical protein L6R37_007076 [Teloschistes peruensis]|nr:MAG: hypothetical protein L6R37_007076 [Teloschistes peruensis]